MLVLRTTSRTWTLSIRLYPIITLAFILSLFPRTLCCTRASMSLLRVCFAHLRLRTMSCVQVTPRKTQTRCYVDSGAHTIPEFFVTFLRQQVYTGCEVREISQILPSGGIVHVYLDMISIISYEASLAQYFHVHHRANRPLDTKILRRG